MGLLLKNLRWVTGNDKFAGDIRISHGKIRETGVFLDRETGEDVVDFENQFVYPGLINAHDHLEMNLYPKLGHPPYGNYTEWGRDIYKPALSPIKEIEKVDIKDRLLWGGLRNLISGATTVVHHNPWHSMLEKKEFPVKVIKTTWAHSLAFEKDLRKKVSPTGSTPFVIHAAEGTDEMAFSEITKINDLGLLKKNTVLVHAIAMKENDIEMVVRNECAVVWCPASNRYMFNQTAPIKKLKSKIKIGIGTDSTLTGSATLLDEIRAAHQTNLMDCSEIYGLATSGAASIFNLVAPSININAPADLFIAPARQDDYYENLLHIHAVDIKLVLLNGIVKLMDGKTVKLPTHPRNIIHVNGSLKFIDLDFKSLKKRIDKKIGAGILQSNPLWKLMEA